MTWDMQLQGGLSPNDIYFTDLMTGWCIESDGVVLYTNDGGLNWIVQLSNAYYIFEIDFTDDQHAWIVGYEGVMWNTSNGGATWTKSYLPTLNAFCSISAVDQEHVWVCGMSGAILKYTGEGNNSHDFNDDISPGVEIAINQQADDFLVIPESNEQAITATTLRVYSLQGSLVYQVTNQDNFDINSHSYLQGLNLEAGIYIMQLIRGGRVETKKVLIF
jgi:hypothetical protein